MARARPMTVVRKGTSGLMTTRSAAEQGLSVAQYDLGIMFSWLHGRFRPKATSGFGAHLDFHGIWNKQGEN